MKMNMKMRKIW